MWLRGKTILLDCGTENKSFSIECVGSFNATLMISYLGQFDIKTTKYKICEGRDYIYIYITFFIKF